MECSTPGLPVHHQLPELTQTHAHWVADAIQPSHPLSSPSLPAFNLSQHQGPFQWVSSLHQVAKVLEFQLQHQSCQWTLRTDFPHLKKTIISHEDVHRHLHILPNRPHNILMLLFSDPVMSDSLCPCGLQCTRPPCPSPSPGACPSSCPLHQWCHPAISSSEAPFFCPQSFPASGTSPMSQLFTSDDQNTGASALESVLPTSIQSWFPLRLTGLMSLLFKDPSHTPAPVYPKQGPLRCHCRWWLQPWN